MAQHSPDLTDAPAIAQAIRRMVGATDSSRVRTSMSGTHLHMTTVMTGAPDAFRRTITRKGKRRVCVVMDMSGSMSSAFMHHGGAFIEAMLILQRQNVFDTDVILSGGGRRYRLPKDTPTSTILKLHASHGCESIMATLENEKATVMQADTVLVYTDGQLTDGDIDTAKWRSRGVDLIGVMATEGGKPFGLSRSDHEKMGAVPLKKAMAASASASKESSQNIVHFQREMNKHFHKAIVAETGRELAVRITQYVLAREK